MLDRFLLALSQSKGCSVFVRLSSLLAWVLAAGCWLSTHATVARGGTVPAGFEDVSFIQNVPSPTAMAFAPDGRLFICQQGGSLRVVKNGTLLGTAFMSLSVTSDGERGLLGVAFDPGYSTNRCLYVYYTTSGTPRNRISRFRASAANPDVAEANSEVMMLEVASASGYHNGGALAFGADQMLYAGVGEAHTSANSQSLSVLNGKLLRLDVARYPQIIPSDNPFVGVAGARGEIWVLGLRNPFTFAVEPGTGRIYINDVGDTSREEINLGQAGKNYGWPTCEGACANANFTNPLYAYDRNNGCAITGGTFYQGNQFPPEYAGSYFFADYCSDWIRRLKPDNTAVNFAIGVSASPIDLDMGPDGSLYYLSRSPEVRRIRYVTGNRNPTATLSANPTTGAIPLVATFNGQGSSDPDGDSLTYTWNFGDGSSATGLTVSHTYTNAGTFTAQLTVNDGQGGQATRSVTIRAGSPPAGVIVTPVAGAPFSAGETIPFSGTASDLSDGPLPASAFTWTVLLHHDAHTHPALGPIHGTRSGSFRIPVTGETSPNIKYVFYLSVTNSLGLSHSLTQEILPRKSEVTIATQPPGLAVTLDGRQVTAPFTFTGVVGMERELGAVSPQDLNGTPHGFVSWSDGGALVHRISTPPTNATYTIHFWPLIKPSPPARLRVVAP